MKTLKKCIAFVLAAGLMLSAVTVFAADDPYYSGEATEDPNRGNIWQGNTGANYYEGNQMPTDSNTPDDKNPSNGDRWLNTDTNAEWVFDGVSWSLAPKSSCLSGSSSDSGEPSAKSPEDIAAIQQRAEADAVQGAAYDEGFADVGDMYRAAEKGMSAGEYYNNAVVSTPGIENAITVGQGGNLVVDGKVTNMSATISKVTNRAYVDSVRIEQEGTVLNVVDVQYPAVEATINFYTPGVLGGMEIVALQYNAGTWVEVEVAEVRDDHIVLNMKGNGVVAFIAK